MTTAEVTTLSAAIVLGALQAWNTYKSSKRDKAVAATAKTVDVIHTLTNSQMGVVLLNLAKSTALNYSLDKTELNKVEADKAMAAYNDHSKKQQIVDANE